MNKCNNCGLIVHDGEMQQRRVAVALHRNVRCGLGFHHYEKVGHLYENHEPPSVAIYKKCVRCGKVNDSSVDVGTLEYTTTRASNGSAQERGPEREVGSTSNRTGVASP